MILEEIKRAFTENRTAVLVSVAILACSLILGYFLQPSLYDYLNPVVEDFAQNIKTGVIKLTFSSIFLNNIRIVFSMFIFGAVFCFSGAILAFNGFFVGYYVATVDDFLKAMLLIVPHGIFEFPSCIIACASGFVLFNFIFRFLKNLLMAQSGSVSKDLQTSFADSFDKLKQAIVLLLVASILMAIAGFVEVYLTFPIAEFFYSIFR